jgi:hypothetical protein
LRRGPAGCGPEPNQQAHRREDHTHRIALASRQSVQVWIR